MAGQQLNSNIDNNLASTTAKGVVEEATQAQVNAGTDTGETGARLFATPSKIIAYVASILASYLTSAAAVLTYTPLTRTINTTSPLSGGGDLSANRTLTTSMNTNKLIGRSTAGVGVMEEITIGTGLTLSAGTLAFTGKYYEVRVVTAAGAVTITTDDELVVLNKTVGAATTVNLPASPSAGDWYIIKDGKGDAVTNNITLDPDGATTIDGSATYILNENYGSISIVYNGTEWNII